MPNFAVVKVSAITSIFFVISAKQIFKGNFNSDYQWVIK